MLRSMTAFARSERPCDDWLIVWELRSVNHRYLELGLRLPEAVRSLEPTVRERMTQTLNRGKVDAALKLQSAPGTGAGLALNRPLVERLLDLTAEVESLMGPGTGLQVGDVLRWPGAVGEAELNQEQLQAGVLAGLDAALADLVATRAREGERIAQLLRQRCAGCAEQVARVRRRRPDVLARQRELLLARLAGLPVEPDSNRLEQELAIAAQRLDVAEELDRLDAHLAEIGDVFVRGEPVGRRLDFLSQELNREANTLSSKSCDTETTRAAVELKVLIEQMREQIQNVE